MHRLFRRRVPFVVVLLACLFGSSARADQTSHEAAVRRLYDTMHMKETIDQSVKQMVDMQVQQNPTIAPYRQQLLDFLQKYMSWDQIEPDLTKVYMETFTEEEISELIRFYSTPVGQKAVSKMPELLSKGAAIGQARVQAHIGELQQSIREAAARHQGSGDATPPSATPSTRPSGM